MTLHDSKLIRHALQVLREYAGQRAPGEPGLPKRGNLLATLATIERGLPPIA